MVAFFGNGGMFSFSAQMRFAAAAHASRGATAAALLIATTLAVIRKPQIAAALIGAIPFSDRTAFAVSKSLTSATSVGVARAASA
jgi:hypothetical protein